MGMVTRFLRSLLPPERERNFRLSMAAIARQEASVARLAALNDSAQASLARYNADLEAEKRRREDCWSGVERRSFRAMRKEITP